MRMPYCGFQSTIPFLFLNPICFSPLTKSLALFSIGVPFDISTISWSSFSKCSNCSSWSWIFITILSKLAWKTPIPARGGGVVATQKVSTLPGLRLNGFETAIDKVLNLWNGGQLKRNSINLIALVPVKDYLLFFLFHPIPGCVGKLP